MIDSTRPASSHEPVQHHQRFRAMDTAIDVLIEADTPPLAGFIGTRLLFEQQEERFSRFRPSSLLSALNRGEHVTDPWFAAACRLTLEASAMTGRLYNPMVLPALHAAGYDRTFAEVSGGRPLPAAAPDPTECLRLDGDSVSLATGALDLGGVVKGWTVDEAVGRLLDAHPDVLVNAGGDLRCAGAERGLDGWQLTVDGIDGSHAWQGIVRGAVATSTTLKRRWRTAAGTMAHHLIDPRTGLPSDSGVVQATVFARETWRAEVWAKAVVIGGEATARECVASGHRVITLDAAGAAHEW